MAFPTYTKVFHTAPYPSISPTRKELSTKGKVIFITGGGSGVGPRIAHAFATSGANSISIIGRTSSTLLSTKQEIESEHPGVTVLTFTADIADTKAVRSAFEETKKAFGPVDVLVANAAYLPDTGPIVTIDIDDWFRGFEVNVKGNLNLAQAFLANCASKNAVLVQVNTGGAHLPPMPFGMSGYTISKLAAARLNDTVALENPHIRCITMHPGIYDTPGAVKAVKAGMAVPPDDIELAPSAIVWVASPEAEFLRGKFIWANWDVDELIAKKEQLVSSNDLTIGLLGWP